MGEGSYPVTYFGKLPVCGDFVRYRASGSEVTALDQWLQEGLHYARARFREGWRSNFRKAPTQSFLFAPEGADVVLVGVLRPSRDRSGRSFPFLISLQIDRLDLNGRSFSLVPVLFEPFRERTEQLIQRAIDGLDIREITNQTEDLATVAGDFAGRSQVRYHQYLRDSTLSDLWARLYGDADDGRKRALLKNLSDILLPMRGRDPSRSSLGLRFPIGDDSRHVAWDASFWLETSSRILGSQPGTPHVFWTSPGGRPPRYLYLFFRRPSPKLVAKLLKSDFDCEHVCELDDERVLDEGGGTDTIPALRWMLGREGAMTLDEFLNRLPACG